MVVGFVGGKLWRATRLEAGASVYTTWGPDGFRFRCTTTSIMFIEYSARIYRPAFSWKQAQNCCIQSLKTSVLGMFSRKLVYNFGHSILYSVSCVLQEFSISCYKILIFFHILSYSSILYRLRAVHHPFSLYNILHMHCHRERETVVWFEHR